MTKKRRFSLTQVEAETIILALKIAISIAEDEEIRESPYAAWRKAQFETLEQKLTNYKWEV